MVLSWLVSLISLLRLDTHHLNGWSGLAIVLLRTQLQTGLFIVGHDAMHGLLWAERRPWNDAIGAVALALYAALPYRQCLANHRRHHRFPGTQEDPDFCSPVPSGPLHWYRRFMGHYLTRSQMGWLLLFWASLVLIFGRLTPTAAGNVLLVCILPLLLSSVQLFVFGTYLPHRVQRAPTGAAHPASLDLPPWMSLLACFHFGYHREHHDHPGLSWFELPSARQRPSCLTLASPARYRR